MWNHRTLAALGLLALAAIVLIGCTPPDDTRPRCLTRSLTMGPCFSQLTPTPVTEDSQLNRRL